MASSSSITCLNLCDQTHCDWWLEQIVCLLESHGMNNVFLDVRLKPTKENGDSKKKADKSFFWPKKSDALVILIYGSLSDHVFCTAFSIHKTNDVRKKVDASYKYSTHDQLQVGWTIGTYTQTQRGFRSSSTNAKEVELI